MDRRDVLLWAALVAGPLAWFLDLVASFVLEPEPGEPWRPGVMHAITGGALVIVAAAVAISVAMLRSERERGPAHDRVGGRRVFLAVGAVAVSIGSGVLVLATSIPKWMLGPGVHP